MFEFVVRDSFYIRPRHFCSREKKRELEFIKKKILEVVLCWVGCIEKEEAGKSENCYSASKGSLPTTQHPTEPKKLPNHVANFLQIWLRADPQQCPCWPIQSVNYVLPLLLAFLGPIHQSQLSQRCRVSSVLARSSSWFWDGDWAECRACCLP